MTVLSASTLASNYPVLAGQCRTQNQFNRLHIDLENILAPAELGYLARLAADRALPEMSYSWLQRLKGLSPDLLDEPRPFHRTGLADTVTLYRDQSREPAGKGLLVAFTGGSRRLMMPVSVFLQHLDSSAWDVVVLRKGPDRRPYAHGLEGVSRSLPAVMRYVAKASEAKRYRRVVTLGTSGGGFAAIIGAILMAAKRAISIGGHQPSASPNPWLRLQLAIRHALQCPEFEYVFGADFDRDRESALVLRNSFGGTLHPVPGVTQHNPFRVLLARGELAAFLKEILA
jgi:hypothetical protein